MFGGAIWAIYILAIYLPLPNFNHFWTLMFILDPGNTVYAMKAYTFKKKFFADFWMNRGGIKANYHRVLTEFFLHLVHRDSISINSENKAPT